MYSIKVESKVMSELNNLIGENIKVTEFLKGTRKKCIVECAIHGKGNTFGTPWIPDYSNLINGSGCPKCKNNYIETETEALENLKPILKNKNIEILGFKNKYNGKRTKCEVECDFHGKGSDWGNPWSPSYDTLKRGFGCPKCAGQYKNSESEALSLLQNKINSDKIRVSSFFEKYKGSKTRCIAKCHKHGDGSKWGTPWIPTYNNLTRGISCPKCAGHYVEVEKEAAQNIRLLLKKSNISFLGFKDKYKGNTTRCILKCNIHGNGIEWSSPWIPKLNYLRNGSRCPKCSKERKELFNCLKYIEQFRSDRYLYFVTFKNVIKNTLFYKIGISNYGVHKRFRQSALKKDNVEIVDFQEIKTNNINVLLAEYWALRHFSNDRKFMLHILKNCKGGTECFSKDVTKDLSLIKIIEESKKDFKKVLKDFDLSKAEKHNAIIEFKALENTK